MKSSDWLSFHLYYHEDQRRAVQGLIRPVAIDLLQSEDIDRFFFLRYGLGGPHLRIRLRPVAGRREAVQALVERQALQFLATDPSKSPLSREAIENATRSILQSDAHETEDTVYPDNHFQLMEFRPETDRYGGPELLEASLDLFAVSSLEALVFLDRHAAASRSRQLPWVFRLLCRQAIGFAANSDELGSLLRYAEISWREAFPGIVEKADETFNKQREIFVSLFEQEMRTCLSGSKEPAPGIVLFEAARSLRRVMKELEAERCWVVGGSQLHMTANRLFLSNPEEVYTSRLLSQTWHHLQATGHAQLGGADWNAEPRDGSEATLRRMNVKLEELIRQGAAAPP